MTQQQINFINEYILTGSPTKAAEAAGYKHAARQGYRLLHTPEVRAEIDKRLAEIDSGKILSQQKLLEFLSAVVVGNVADEQLMTRLVGKGNSVIERYEVRTPTRERIKAAETLLKIQGAFNQTEQSTDAGKLLADTLTAIWSRQESQPA